MSYKLFRIQTAFILSTVWATGSSAELLIKNVKIVNGDQSSSYEQADILIHDGKIVSIGENLQPTNSAESLSIDYSGKVVTAGFFNAATQIGLREVSAVKPTVDSSTVNNRITASLRVSDAINPSSVVIPHNRMLGLTHTLIQPSNGGLGLFSGTAAVINLSDNASVEVRDAAMVVTLGEHGSEVAGGSRAAAMALLREAIEDTKDYANNKGDYNQGKRRSYPLSRHDLQALVPVIQGKMPLLVKVERAADIARVLEFASKYQIKLILSGVSEGWKVADKIAAAGVPVIFDPINNLPSSYESLGARLDNAAILDKAGVTLMFTGMGWQSTHNANLVRQSAGNAVANGLSYHAAIKAITSNPAKVFGVKDYGSVQPGKDATLVVWSGDPLEVTTLPEVVMIKGESYPLESRATRLRDRYFQRLRQSTEDP